MFWSVLLDWVSVLRSESANVKIRLTVKMRLTRDTDNEQAIGLWMRWCKLSRCRHRQLRSLWLDTLTRSM